MVIVNNERRGVGQPKGKGHFLWVHTEQEKKRALEDRRKTLLSSYVWMPSYDTVKRKTVIQFQDLSHPDVSEYTRQSWPFYTTMQAVVGALPLSQVLTKKGRLLLIFFFTL